MNFDPIEITTTLGNKIFAKSVYMVLPAYVKSYTYHFTDIADKKIEVNEHFLDAANKAKARTLFGRPWLQEVYEKLELKLVPADEDEAARFEDTDRSGIDKYGSPISVPDTRQIWRIDDISDAFIIEGKTNVTLRTLNNAPIIKQGNLDVGLRALFPDQTIKIVTYETIRHERILT